MMGCLAIATVETEAGPAVEMEQAVERAFLTARLLTASVGRAENAILGAIQSWYPDDGLEDLFERAMDAAVSHEIDWGAAEREPDDEGLPPELRRVLSLPDEIRRCYVLRVLAGMPAEACAGMLRLHAHVVDELTSAALYCLDQAARNPAGAAKSRKAPQRGSERTS
jgi:hypothetical protein